MSEQATNHTRPDWMDHPLQEGWLTMIMQPMDSAHQRALTERFRNAPEDPEDLISAVDIASLRTDTHRQTQELSNALRLSRRISGEELARNYTSLAGYPDKLGTYIHWFGRAATGVLRNRTPKDDFDSISLELGSKRQNGDWECTGNLDDMIEAIPDVVREVDPTAIIKRSPKTATKLGYLLMPLFTESAETYSGFQYAILRRRRAVMDIEVPGCHKLAVFKQSHGLVVVSELDPEKQKKIRVACNTHGPEWSVQKNNSVANLAGYEFEQAIEHPDRSDVTTVVPLSAQYVMKVNG